jgi:acetyl esterase/lipase
MTRHRWTRAAGGLLALGILGLPACRAADNHRRLLPEATTTLDVSYAADDARQALDVYAPRTPGPHPVVVFVHGGYWHTQGRRYLQPLTGLYGNVGVALAARGVVAVLPSYRLFPAATLDQELDDVLSALVWARAHAAEHGGDPRRLVLAGHSAGAHLIMTAATSPERLRARGLAPEDVRGYVALSGIYDVPGLLERADPELREVLVPLFGDTPASWSVLDRLGPQLAPTLFVVGEVDYRSCRLDFTAARARLRGSGRAAFLVLEGQTHAEVVLGLGGRHDTLAPRLVEFVRRVTR